MKTRLQRFLADCGVASRRECEAMIQGGRVRVNGEVRTNMPVMVEPETDVITVDEMEVGGVRGGGATVGKMGDALTEQAKVYFLLNKPKGILVTASDPKDRKTVHELMKGVKERVFPVGRLDMESRGALIMTNDGELANRLTHPRYGVEKTYIIEVDGRVGHEDLEKVKRGMWLGPEFGGGAPGQGATKTERFKVKLVGRERGRTILEVKLSEAKNREIRRVMARLGHTVRDLNRVAIGGKVTVKGLEPGEFRELSEAEVKWLFKASAPEFHAQQKSATQTWYEKKEMDKERRRLEREGEPKPAARAKPVEKSLEEKEFRPRPERKGKKPSVPPTGRNAGKQLGGNFLGRQRLEREQLGDDEDMPTTPPSQLPEHPLGADAGSED